MSDPDVVQGLEPLTVVQDIAPPPLDVSTCPLVPEEPFARKPPDIFTPPDIDTPSLGGPSL